MITFGGGTKLESSSRFLETNNYWKYIYNTNKMGKYHYMSNIFLLEVF